ncbi:MAG TPA: UbiA family prenyltransferase [Pontiella sp.]
MSSDRSIPLCVDLDGTLVKLDTLQQALFLLLRRRPACLLKIPRWIFQSKAHMKDQVMQNISLDASVLPYNQTFLNWLREEKAQGRKLVLATGANFRTANAVAEHLEIFDDILSSNEEINLRHNRKLEAIRERFQKFSYAGNDAADFPIWDAAEEIILVNPTRSSKRQYAAKASLVFTEQRPVGFMALQAMRPKQWLKNILIFSPMILAHRFTEMDCLMKAGIAFVAFSLAASSIYILNDLFDLSADQHHPRKKNRPFAAGNLSIVKGALLSSALVALSFVISTLLPPLFSLTLLVYYFLTTLYSWKLKQVAVADSLTLAALYAMRIVAGATATATVTSEWFIEFSIFLFLSLALVKRTSELREPVEESEYEHKYRERGYQPQDLPLLLAFGTASGYLSVFVFTMYLGSEKVAHLYTQPEALWMICPLILYWVTRIWHLAWRGEIHDDPIAFATKDLQTYLVGAIAAMALLYAI